MCGAHYAYPRALADEGALGVSFEFEKYDPNGHAPRKLGFEEETGRDAFRPWGTLGFEDLDLLCNILRVDVDVD